MMTTRRFLAGTVAAGLGGLLLIAGCGGGDETAVVERDASSMPEGNAEPPDPTETGGTAGQTSSGAQGALAAETGSARASGTAGPTNSAEGEEKIPEPEKGSPEWMVREIIKLRVQKLAETDDLEQMRTARHERNQQIIQLAEHAIAATHEDPEKQQTFNVAVHHLMEARRQLALSGDRHQIDALYEHAEALYRRDPASKAAAEAAYALARFAHENARRFAKEEPRWLTEFSHQARVFANKFPQEQARAVPLLFSAGWTCELHRMREEAIHCYTLLGQQFPKTPQARTAVAILRRLKLEGKSPQFAGPTIDGGFVSIDDFKGNVVLVVFWASDSKRFIELLPNLLTLSKKHEEAGLQIVGVNLDDQEPAVDAFLETNDVPWPNIFYSERTKRRWDNPLVKYYGVRDIPMLWLIDRGGVVTNTMVDPVRLETEVGELLGKDSPAAK